MSPVPAIEQHLGGGGRRHLSAAASGRSGHSDVSERIEEILRSIPLSNVIHLS
jgi:hypothetical protein